MSNRSNTLIRITGAKSARRAALGLAALVFVGVLGACADAPSAPAVASSASAPAFTKGGKNGKGGTKPGQTTQAGEVADTVWPSLALAAPTPAEAVLRTTPLPDSVKASFFVTRAGGQFTVPGTGLGFYVPSNAIPGDTLTITVAAVPGDVLAYRFGPHGTQFKKSLVMWQVLAGTNYLSRGSSPVFSVGYFGETADLNPLLKSALVRELQQRFFDAENARLFWAVNHFSGYMVSWGFRERQDASDRW